MRLRIDGLQSPPHPPLSPTLTQCTMTVNVRIQQYRLRFDFLRPLPAWETQNPHGTQEKTPTRVSTPTQPPGIITGTVRLHTLQTLL